LAALTTLLLDANELKGIPQGLFQVRRTVLSIKVTVCAQLKTLVKLSLKHNYVTNVPSGIAGLESLQELFLNDNKITKVPVHVYRLPKLRGVLLSGNPMDLNVKSKVGDVCEMCMNLL
jgi:Leucine-rich repeat (LRR) protein